MAYSTANLKSNGDKASPHFKTFLTFWHRSFTYKF